MRLREMSSNNSADAEANSGSVVNGGSHAESESSLLSPVLVGSSIDVPALLGGSIDVAFAGSSIDVPALVGGSIDVAFAGGSIDRYSASQHPCMIHVLSGPKCDRLSRWLAMHYTRVSSSW